MNYKFIPRNGAVRRKDAAGEWVSANPHDPLYSTLTMTAEEFWDEARGWCPVASLVEPEPAPPIEEGEFHIEFSTSSVESTGLIEALRVRIEMTHIEMAQEVRIDLCDHPLYPKLERYVLANRRRIQKGKR